jgi:hypothetical protein
MQVSLDATIAGSETSSALRNGSCSGFSIADQADLYSYGCGRQVCVARLSDGGAVETIGTPAKEVPDTAFGGRLSPNGKYLAVHSTEGGGNQGQVTHWGNPVQIYAVTDGALIATAFPVGWNDPIAWNDASTWVAFTNGSARFAAFLACAPNFSAGQARRGQFSTVVRRLGLPGGLLSVTTPTGARLYRLTDINVDSARFSQLLELAAKQDDGRRRRVHAHRRVGTRLRRDRAPALCESAGVERTQPHPHPSHNWRLMSHLLYEQ